MNNNAIDTPTTPLSAPRPHKELSRRRFLIAGTAALGAVALPGVGQAEPRYDDFNAPRGYPDPAWQIDQSGFEELMIGNTPLERHYTEGLWLEGPAWNAVGRYAVFSDIPRQRQMRWDEVSGQVSVLREKVGYSNGNTFDDHGRQVSCEHFPSRVVRYEWDGSITTLASHVDGKPLNAPNDLVALPGGGIIFTDPGYGARVDYEGRARTMELPTRIYYIDDSLQAPIVLDESLARPNGVALSADHKRLFACDTESTDDYTSQIHVWDVADNGKQLSNKQIFYTNKDATHDGIVCDMHGNLWASSAGKSKGANGVVVFDPNGQRLGSIVLPEQCSNVCFVGENRHRLLMTASRSIYTLYTATRGTV
ncbi:SMP-30/gluconolactonase/LRE family protein [Phytohalomonas tamaricis]|uniref:SMP-30/gluconolactonase/LRE family protein n=1 Tax=Phytohalomonas tamaricis TaxID=2081032 RepID=UPI000D0BDA2D|nr:SMP-30/gluconolactonase/LRE family protein [Phytohalomonas tamaricis]